MAPRSSSVSATSRSPSRLSLLQLTITYTQIIIVISNDSQPFCSRPNSLPGADRPIGHWPIRSLEFSLSSPFASWPSRSVELLFSRVFAPRNVRSLELLLPVMSMTLIYDIRLDCTPCYAYAYILMIYMYCCFFDASKSSREL